MQELNTQLCILKNDGRVIRRTSQKVWSKNHGNIRNGHLGILVIVRSAHNLYTEIIAHGA